MSGSLVHTTPFGLVKMARVQTIMNRMTSNRTLWVPNDEQIELWQLMARHRFVFYAKPRKCGISLAGEHALLMETNGADVAGDRCRTVFAIDTDPKALEHLERLEDLASQLKMKVKAKRSAPYSIAFPKGSKIDCLTMGAEEPGRGGDIHRLQITELPFGAHPEKSFHALRSACADSAPVLIETTLTTIDPFTAALWRGARRDPVTRKLEELGTEFYRHVSYVETQRSYRLPTVRTE